MAMELLEQIEAYLAQAVRRPACLVGRPSGIPVSCRICAKGVNQGARRRNAFLIFSRLQSELPSTISDRVDVLAD
jgi:hypothetical protein